ncbi:hypothetical protein JCM10450v2_004561 [Rhodotorula kratochvilovae]
MPLQRHLSGSGADNEKDAGNYKDLVVSTVRDVPDAAAIATAAIANMEISDEEARKLVRKIDRSLMPLLCITYCLQFLDKTSLSYAALAYLVGEWPTNYALQRLPLAKWTSANVVLWGIVIACTAACKDFKSLMVVRFFLGLLEACVSPAFALITSQWYLKREQGARTGFWFSCNSVANFLGAFLSWGFAKHDAAGDFALAGWKVMFLFLGGVTITMGIVLMIFLPDSPLSARFLSEQERLLAVERIRSNNTGIGAKAHKWYQVREAFLDPLTWLYCLFAVALNIFNGGITSFFSILIASFGYSKLDSLMYSAPGGAVTFVTMLGFMWLGDKIRMRILCGMMPLCIGLMGVLLIWLLPDSYNVGRLCGYYFSLSAMVGFIVVLSLISSNVSGSTKKTTVQALFFIFYAVGNLIGPQTFRQQDAPRYSPALATATAVICFGIVDLALIWFLNVRENRRKEKITSDPGYVPKQNQEFLDLTDRENPAFRYVC